MVELDEDSIKNALISAFEENYGVLHRERDIELVQTKLEERTGEQISREKAGELLEQYNKFPQGKYTYSVDESAYKQYIVHLFEENNGKIHRSDAVPALKEHYGYDRDTCLSILERNLEDGFNEQGWAFSYHDEYFSGDIGNLNQTPGEVTAEEWKAGLQKLEDIGHPLVPDMDTYLERTVEGTGSTDAEVLARAMSDPDFSPLLVGDAGTGKDTLVRYVCAQTNRPCVRVNFGKDVRYADLVGTRLPAESEDGEGTKIVWEDGMLTRAVQYGYVFIADEINAAPPEATMPLHQVTEEGDDAELVIREESRTITPHPQFRFVATMNPPRGGYGGVEQLNDAFKSRFYSIEVDYLDASDEADLLRGRVKTEGLDISDSRLTELTELAADLREQYQRGDITTPVTTRELIKICKMSEIMSVKQAARMILTGHAKESDQRLIKQRIRTEL